MIEVWLDRTALTVRGHAGFSRYGSDIVCAAASMLAFALAEAVQAAGLKTPPVIESGCGRFQLRRSRTDRSRRGWTGCLRRFARDTGCSQRGIRTMCGFWVNVTLKI